MAKCGLCGKGGLFLKVSSIGLCPSCQRRFDLSILRQNQVWTESTKIMETSKSIETKLSRCGVALSALNVMRDFGEGKYDVLFAVTETLQIDSIISDYKSMQKDLAGIVEGFEEIIFRVLKEHGSVPKQKFVEVFNANVKNCGRNPSELPYSVDKSITDILKRLEYESKIVKEKAGSKYIYSAI